MWSKNKIDLTAEILISKKKALKNIQLEIQDLESQIEQHFEELSSDTNTATVLAGGRNTIKRSLTKIIRPDDLRVAIGEWIEPDDLEKCIRPERSRIVDEPEKVMLTEVNELLKQGGEVAERIEKCTIKTTKTISIKENVSDN
jgi:hypothetical protein